METRQSGRFLAFSVVGALLLACSAGKLTSVAPDSGVVDAAAQLRDAVLDTHDEDARGGDRDVGDSPDGGLICGDPCSTPNLCETGIVDCETDPPACIREALRGEGEVCRVALGPCDVAEACDGISAECPVDARQPAEAVCRPAAAACDVPEVCDGAAPACPVDGFEPTGATCLAGFCDGLGTCMSGCTPGAPCSTGNICETGEIECGGGAPVCVRAGDVSEGTSCAAAETGSWGPCGEFSGTCDESGSQSRSVVRYECVSGTCEESLRQENRDCSRSRAGTACGAVANGSWSDCGGFTGACDDTGTRSRSVMTPTCNSESCTVTTSVETQSCSRTLTGCMTVDRSHCAGTTGTAARHCQIDIRDPANDSGSGFFEYLPTSYNGSGAHPLIIYFHGRGGVGNGRVDDGLNRVDDTSIPRLISRNDWPPAGVATSPAALDETVVLSPQWGSGGCHSPSVVAGFIDWAVERYSVDRRRVYLTGQSCGAIAIWNYLRRYFKTSDPVREVTPAATVPIAGNGGDGGSGWGPNNDLCGVGRIPIWAFHGSDDNTVRPTGATNAINGLNAGCTGPLAPVDARLTIYPGRGHNDGVWLATYDGRRGHDIYSWMFSFTAP